FQIGYETDYRKLLNSDEIQGVSIVTPSPTHYQLTRDFIDSKKDVLVEKPMTLDVGEAEKLVDVVKNSEQVCMVGHIFRYHPSVLELKRRLDAREFGEVIYLFCNRLAFRAPRQDMGVLYALTIHEVDLFCYLLNHEYPESIFAVLSNYYQPEIEETAMVTMNFPNNVKCFAFESWLSPIYGKQRDLVLIGTHKSARIDYLKPHELQIFDSSVVEENVEGRKEFKGLHEGSRVLPIDYKEPLKEEFKHFVARMKDRGKPNSDVRIGQRAVEMVEKAKESAAKNTPISF
ncbi:MAG: Gfo/Idh/MocA family oxidoreductase, partial [Thermoplasmata archaeon]